MFELVFSASPEAVRNGASGVVSIAQSADGGTWQSACFVISMFSLVGPWFLNHRDAEFSHRYEVALLPVHR
jgi:hypothetical protein